MPDTTREPPKALTGFIPKFSDPNVHLEGVRGWLLWFCIVTVVIQPVMNLPAIKDGKTFIAVALFCALSITTGTLVWQRKPAAFLWLKWYLGTYMAAAVLIAVGGGARKNADTIATAIFILWHAIIWAAYFMKSKRVLANFGRNL